MGTERVGKKEYRISNIEYRITKKDKKKDKNKNKNKNKNMNEE
jgi:hypothetical protein